MQTSEAIANAVRLLEACEAETNLQYMDCLIRCSEIWVQLAHLLREIE